MWPLSNRDLEARITSALTRLRLARRDGRYTTIHVAERGLNDALDEYARRLNQLHRQHTTAR